LSEFRQSETAILLRKIAFSVRVYFRLVLLKNKPAFTMLKSLLHPLLSKISQKASLRVILACLVLQIPAAVGLTGYLAFKNGQKAVDNLATQLTNEVADHVEHKLEDFVTIPQLVTRQNADEVRYGNLNLNDLPEFSSSTISDLTILPF
jgi:hypothetical protein